MRASQETRYGDLKSHRTIVPADPEPLRRYGGRIETLCAGCIVLAAMMLSGCEGTSSEVPSPAKTIKPAQIANIESPTATPKETATDLVVNEPGKTPEGMVWLPGGAFVMGTNFEAVPGKANPDRIKPDEYPAHRVELDGFWMKATAVTNAEFREFVTMTGYKTLAERPLTREDLIRSGVDPNADLPATMRPNSICFKRNFDPKSLVVGPQNWEYQLWEIVEGANWKNPEGPGSSIDERMNHPVVHVNWDDAMAYCTWAGLTLPTEAQFEYASRSGGKPVKYPWGNAITSDGEEMCNYYQGTFPTEHLNLDGFLTTSPVKSFPPNAAGLYDLSGNVWEWCHDLYDGTYYARSPVRNPQGPERSHDPFAPPGEERQVKRVQRGGSFLCNVNNCTGYRCGARMRAEETSSTFHTGFRGVLNVSQRETYQRQQQAIAEWRASQPVSKSRGVGFQPATISAE